MKDIIKLALRNLKEHKSKTLIISMFILFGVAIVIMGNSFLESKDPNSKSPVDSFSKAEKEEWINFLIEKVGLTEWKNHKANELSGGQRQRVAIARALVTKAPVILADEPTANLDSKNSEQILKLMKSLNKDPDLQTTFIFSTHDSRIVDMCDHVVHILDGQVINDEHKEGSDVYKI